MTKRGQGFIATTSRKFTTCPVTNSQKQMNYYRKHKELRKMYGYDPCPPICRNCKHQTLDYKISLQGPVKWCGKNEFALPSLHGVCDAWEGKDGSMLDAQRENPISTLVAHLVKTVNKY